MMWRIKIDKADQIFSKYIRLRDGRCVYCGSQNNLTNSHYHSRRKESVRFDTENCDTLCLKCHLILEHEKGWTKGTHNGGKVELPKLYTSFKLRQLGQKRYDALLLRANTFKKKDRKFSYLIAKKLYDDLSTKKS